MQNPRIRSVVTPAAMLLAAFMAAGLVWPPTHAAAQSFGGAFEGMSNSKEPIQIEADRLEVVDGEGTALFEGNVAVSQGSTLLKTKRLKVYYSREAQSDATGGNIRNASTTAAFLAADADRSIRMEDVVRGIDRELEKLGRLRTEADFGPYFRALADD